MTSSTRVAILTPYTLNLDILKSSRRETESGIQRERFVEREREREREKMWHEARKQEKKIRDAMVDFQKRAERRRQHYEKKVCAYGHVQL